jgi:uncharacterized protein
MAEIAEKTQPELGFGFMRLPKNLSGKDEYDIPLITQLVDYYLSSGFSYFDTAYVYDNGNSERILKTVLTDRYPRSAFRLTDKLPVWAIGPENDMTTLFETSLNRCGVEYFDTYLLHGLNSSFYRLSQEFGAWDYVKGEKERGRIRHIGFSFHDEPALLERILNDHPETEMVQLQINYADWNSNSVRSRECYEIVRAHDLPVYVMEPVKGGRLATLPHDICTRLTRINESASVASWAFRFVAELDGVACILSGMNSFDQLEDNVNTFKALKPLSETEHNAIEEVTQTLANLPVIPCTQCRYCVDNCPQGLEIPALIKTLNDYLTFQTKAPCQREYNMGIARNGDAATCLACGSCEAHCPQHINIVAAMGQIGELFG